MKQPKFNTEQIAELLKNQHITKCSPKAVSYDKSFKTLAVKQYNEGKTATQIFRDAGLNQQLIGEGVPDGCLGRWRRKYSTDGEAGLMSDGRGTTKGNKGRPKTKGITDADRIKRLEIEVAYLKAKNDFLVKLRAQRKS